MSSFCIKFMRCGTCSPVICRPRVSTMKLRQMQVFKLLLSGLISASFYPCYHFYLPWLEKTNTFKLLHRWETSLSCKLNCWNKIKDFYSTSLSSSGSAAGGAAVAVSHCYCFMHWEFKHAQKELEISGTVSLGVGVLDKKLENTLFVCNLKPQKAIVNNPPRDQDPQWPKFKRLQPWL